MRRLLITLLALLFGSQSAWCDDSFQTAKLEVVKAHPNGRISFWEGKVPIYDGYPFHDLTLALNQKKYIVRYESMSGHFPSRWKTGSEIKVRVQGKEENRSIER